MACDEEREKIMSSIRKKAEKVEGSGEKVRGEEWEKPVVL